MQNVCTNNESNKIQKGQSDTLHWWITLIQAIE